MKRNLTLGALFVLAIISGADFAFAEEAAGASSGLTAVGAGIAIGFAALGGTLGQGKAASSALDSIGRNPSASGKLFVPMILALALIESLVIVSFIIANSIVGKL